VTSSATRRARVLLAMAAALALAACGGGGGGGDGGAGEGPSPPPLPDPQYLASGQTPFAAACDGAAPNGVLYTNAEVEPYLAVNPRNLANLIGVWQQDRWSNGGARGLLTGVSFDGGKTWLPRMAPLSRCTGGTVVNGGDYARASDPWVTFAPDGTAYQISISLNGAGLAPGSSSAVLVSRSADGGLTWSDPVTLIRDGEARFNDKESITADPADPRYVYAVWDRLAPDDTAPAWFARTTDGGLTWEPAHAIYDPGANASTLNNQIVVLPDGTLIDFFSRFNTVGNATAVSLNVIRSLDKGLTWSVPIGVAAAQAIGARDPEAGTPVRDGAHLGAIAAGAHGELVVVWQDARFGGGTRDGIAFSRSQDGGLTWSTPARINRDATVQAFTPSVAIRADGTIAVTYYDFRSNTGDAATLPTDYWITRSADGVTWRESRVAGPFDLATAPNALGLFLGDYQSLVAIGSAFVPFYVATNGGNTGNRTDVFASLVSSAGAAAGLKSAQTEGVMRAAPAAAMAVTPELIRKLDESAARTLERRAPGRPSATAAGPASRTGR